MFVVGDRGHSWRSVLVKIAATVERTCTAVNIQLLDLWNIASYETTYDYSPPDTVPI